LRLSRTHREEGSVESVDARENSAGANVLRVGAQSRIQTWIEVVLREACDRLLTFCQIRPEFLDTCCPRKARRHANDCNGPIERRRLLPENGLLFSFDARGRVRSLRLVETCGQRMDGWISEEAHHGDR